MKIRREPPSEQIHYKINAPLRVEVGGHEYRTSNWSLDGFTIENFLDHHLDTLPIVAISGQKADEKKRLLLSDAGMDDFLPKPLNKKKLLSLIEHQHVEGSNKPERILLADDDKTTRTVVQAMFKDTDYQIDVVEDGAEALDAVQHEHYDLVLMDLKMPQMDGVEAASAIRSLNPSYSSDEFECLVHIPFQGFDISFNAITKVDKVTDSGTLEVSFQEIGERERDILAFFVEELIRGSMTVIDDVILHIDRPVEPVSMMPDPKPVDASLDRKRAIKSAMLTALYLLIGAGVLAYIFLVLHSNFYRLEIQTAVVSAPIEPIRATADGKIGKVLFSLNTPVLARAPLIVIEDARLEESLDRAKVEIDRRTVLLMAKQKELKAERERLKHYRAITLTQLEQTSANVRALVKRVLLAANQINRFTELRAKGWTTQAKQDEAVSIHAELLGELEQARLDHEQKKLMLKQIEKGHFFSGKKIEGQIKELQAQADLAWDQVMLAKDELIALERHRERLIVTAPVNGRVVKQLRSMGNVIKKGEEVALFERDEARVIAAFLTQEEILEVGLEDMATVYFPSLDMRIKAQVIRIDRTSGYVDEMRSRYEWRGPNDRSALVTLKISDFDEEAVRQRFAPGLPAIVIFARRGTDERASSFKDTLKGILNPQQKTKKSNVTI